MPFNPSYPPTNASIDSAPLRDQFTSLKALIDAASGGGVAHAIVEFVNTVGPLEPAEASVSLDGDTLRFTFSIPQGMQGLQGEAGFPGEPGPQGNDGMPGEQGMTGEQGMQGDPGMPGDPGMTGLEGPPGQDGMPGIDGMMGPEGPPGEVSQVALDAAIADTSSNSNAIGLLGMTADPTAYAPAQLQAVVNKLDELIAALRR